MSGQSAVSVRALARGFTVLLAAFVVLLGGACERESFNLLDPGVGGQPGAGQANVDNVGGHFDAGGGMGDFGGRSGAGDAGAQGSNQAGNSSCPPGTNCNDGGTSCQPTDLSCSHCRGANDCGKNGLPPICDIKSHHCVECIPGNGNCAMDENCDPIFFR